MNLKLLIILRIYMIFFFKKNGSHRLCMTLVKKSKSSIFMILLQENCDHPRTYPMQILIQNLLPFNKLQNELPLLITFPSSTYARLCLLNRLNNGKLLLIDNQNKKGKRDISMVGQCLVWPFSIYLPCGNRLPPATLKFIHFYCIHF